MKKTKSLLQAALEYAAAGIPVIPLHSINSRGTCTCGDKKCSTPGKHPRTRNGLKDATTDPAKIKRWWAKNRWPNASIGGVGGRYLCLDIDPKASGHVSLEELIADNSPLPDTAVAETGEYEIEDGEVLRGRHYWFTVPDEYGDIATRAGIRPGIDVRCYRGYAVLPPSPHVSGVNYEWVMGDGITAASEMPEWLVDLVPEVVPADSSWTPDPSFPMSREVRDFLRGTFGPGMGEQREFLCRAARSVLTTGKDVETTAQLLYEGYRGGGGISASDQDEHDPWRQDEILALVEDTYLQGPNTGMRKNFTDDSADTYLTDLGNAHRLVGSYKKDHVFHVAEWGTWYLWNGTRFTEDVKGVTLRRRFEKVTKEMVAEALRQDSEEEQKRMFQHAMRSQQKARIDAGVSLAQDLVRVPIPQLNADPYMLNVQNGVVDLRTGELLSPDPSLYLTKAARVIYDEDADSDMWQTFLDQVVPDKVLQGFLKKAFGYTLTGLTSEHKFFYLHGPPASGKTTLLGTLEYLMGNYSESADPTTFMRNPNRQASGPTEDLARLANARLVVTSEVEDGMRFAEGHISKLTGGDKVTARFLHESTFSFYPKFKLWFSANHKPRVSGSSRSGIWRRILIVPMEQAIPEEDRDPTLNQRLRHTDVLSSVLNWAIEGCQEWIKDHEAHRNMEVPAIVKHEVEEYQLEADHVAGFMSEMLVVTGEGTDRIPKPDVFEAYLGWCDREGRKQTFTKNMLTRRLLDAGLTWKQAQCDGKRQDCWIGVEFSSSMPRVKKRRRK